ncbi:MAG: SAM-dependent DNA methyltransferase [Mesotoga sp.]|jgi:hypothetical protein|nr:SAM-dependent DNA methyltransferase [Mesotoga sp.]HON28628.1 N-6 DNA methylase [Mesotoga infera]HRR44509.1 N-6 DNA methylase [Mesotoga sp.]
MDLKSFSRNYMYLLSKLGEEGRDLSERAIEYFWTNMLLRKLSLRDNFLDVFREFDLFDKSGLERAGLVEKALKEIISRYPRYGFIDYKGKYVWIFTEGPELLRKTCTYADGFIDSLTITDIARVCGGIYDTMFSLSIDLGLVDPDAAVAMPVVEAMAKLLDLKPGMSVYDPALNFGRAIYSIFKTEGLENTDFTGLETDPFRHRVGKTALAILGVNTVNLKRGDPLFRPEDAALIENALYDRVIIEPPSAERIIHLRLNTGHFFMKDLEIAREPGSQWEYIDHGLEATKPYGKLVSLIDSCKIPEALRSIVDDDLLEAVIALPGSLVCSGSERKSILVINRKKPAERKGKVFLAVPETEREENWSSLADQARWLDSVTDLYGEWKGERGTAGIVSNDRIIENGYDISPYGYAVNSAGESTTALDYAELLEAPMIKLGEVADLIEGVRGERYYRLESYTADKKGVIDIEATCLETREVFMKDDLNLLRESDILLSPFPGRDDMAIVGEMPEGFRVIPGAGMLVLRVKEGYDPRRLFDILRSPMGKYARREAGFSVYMSGSVASILEEIMIPDIVRKKD